MADDLAACLQPALDRDAYLDAIVFVAERDRLFASSWCAVCRTTDLPESGAYVRVELLGTAIVLVRDADAVLHAFHDVCRHRGCELIGPERDAAGRVGAAIRCPYHGWTYGLDGQLQRAPFMGAASADDAAEFALSGLSVAEWGGFVFVRGVGNRPLADELGDIPARVVRYPLAELGVGRREVYEVAANWKVLAENYNECYHCGPVHPELCDLVPGFRTARVGELEWERGIEHREGAYTFTASGTTTRAPFPDLDADERVRHKGELVYPNLLLSLACDHVAAFTLLPRHAGHTTIVFDLLFHPDEIASPAFDPSDAFDFWDTVNRQDWSVCESVQRGMASPGFRGAWFAPMEDPSRDIRAWYDERMR
jgi:Rieske 2Fe-2S family protein